MMDISTKASSNNAEELETLQKQRETFIASLSHDLKNPTIAQIRAMELLLKGKFGQILPEQREIIEMVLDSCKYMNAMLGNVLAIYRNEKGKITLSSEEVSIPELTEECIDEMVYLAKDKGINVIYKNTSKDGIVYGDKIHLRRVIMNLLSNSIKYAFPKTELLVDVFDEDKFTCFKFENHSPYLTPDKQKNIFSRYISYSQTSLSNGVGLGLYASKKIVEAHGGIIFVESFKNDKNKFVFKLPNDKSLKDKKRTVVF